MAGPGHHFYQQIYQSVHNPSDKKYASSTIYTYVSSISHIQCPLGFDNPTATFLPRKLLDAINKINHSKQRLLHMTSELLTHMVDNMNMVKINTKLFCTKLCLIIYFTCVATWVSWPYHQLHQNTFQLDDIKFTKQSGVIKHLTVSFKNYKRNQKLVVHSIQVKPTHYMLPHGNIE